MLIRGRLLFESWLPLIVSGPRQLLTFSTIIGVNTVNRKGGRGAVKGRGGDGGWSERKTKE